MNFKRFRPRSALKPALDGSCIRTDTAFLGFFKFKFKFNFFFCRSLKLKYLQNIFQTSHSTHVLMDVKTLVSLNIEWLHDDNITSSFNGGIANFVH